MEQPTRYYVEIEDPDFSDTGNTHIQNVRTLRAAVRVARREKGQVYERTNIRPRVAEGRYIVGFDWESEWVDYLEMEVQK